MVVLWKLSLIKKIDKVIITHFFCEGNKVVDWIVNKVVYTDKKMT